MRASILFVFAMTAFSAQANPWDDPRHPVVIATDAVESGTKPILRVLHEDGHGGWQLYDGGPLQGNPVVVLKTEALKIDPTLKTLIDLPVEWEATRQTTSAMWVRRKLP